MLQNYILIALRNFNKNKFFIFINILGLGVATACCIVAYLNLQYIQDWDVAHKNAGSIYRVQFWNEFQGNRTRYGTSPIPLGNNIKANMSAVDDVVRFIPAVGQFRTGNETFADQVAYADSSFFDLFTFELLYGSFSDFKDPSKIFISDELAIKYFGRLNVIGSPLTQIIGEKQKEFLIGGVFKKQPLNSSFYSDAYTLWENYWNTVPGNPSARESNWAEDCNLFLRINSRSSLPAITSALQKYVNIRNVARPDLKVREYYLENFKGMAYRNRKEPRMQGEWLRLGIPSEATAVPAIMAVFLLVLACFNFINTSIAMSSKRLKEIGLRKVFGSTRGQLIFQLMAENIILCFLAMLFGLILAKFLVPGYNSLADWVDLELNYSENVRLLFFLLGILLFTALCAGTYPAIYITSFNATNILRDKLRLKGTNWFTRVLLGVQFSIAVLSIIFAAAFFKNGKFQKNYDLGFKTDRVISAYVGNENGYNIYRDALSSNSAITAIAGSKNHIANYSHYSHPVKYNSNEISTDVLEVGDQYVGAMDIKIISGRNFQANSKTDALHSILVTEEFVNKIGWSDDPIGKTILWGDTTRLVVIGVVKNIYARALWNAIRPLIIRYVLPNAYEYIIVKTTPEKMKSVNEFMEMKWRGVFPNKSYPGQRVDIEMARINDMNSGVVKVFSFIGLFCVLLSVFSLYTLVSLNIIKKMKQIGIRKALGASFTHILHIINVEFILILSIASILGAAAGYFASGKVIDSIWDQFTTLNLAAIIITVLPLIIAPLIITTFKTYTTTKINPSTILRNE